MQDIKTKEFLQELKESGKWNESYDYSEVVFKTNETKVIVKDKTFNTEHFISPKYLLHGVVCCGRNLKNGYYPFEKARAFVHNLNLKSQVDWQKYCKSNKKPHYIPGIPASAYKTTGYISLNDWIGTKIGFDGKYLSYEEAKKFVYTLGLKTQEEWKKYNKSGKKPNNIPSAPHIVYKNSGWKSIADWLGTKPGFDGTFLPYEDAKKFVHALNLKSETEWRVYSKSETKPDNIPATPSSVYKGNGWISMGEWLGTYSIHGRYKVYLPYEEAKKFVHTLNLKTTNEWINYCKSGNKPDNIPTDPVHHYSNEWVSMGEWLGTGKIAEKYKKFISFSESKKIIQPLNLQNQKDWVSYCKSGNKPESVPSNPQRIYANDWNGWGDFLGYLGNGKHQWNKLGLIHFIKSLENELINLDSIELITIINSNNLAKRISELGSLEEFVSSEGGSNDRRNTLSQILNRLEDSDEELFDNNDELEDELTNVLIEGVELDVIEHTELIPHNPIAELHMYDNTMVTASLDDENIDFLMKNQLNKLWNNIINKENGLTPESFSKETGGENFTIIKNWFFDEYNKIIKLELPKDYNFRNAKGELIQPNLMQRLTVHRLINEKSYGNWSGTGAGKTLSAILAGRVAGVKNTLIICNNATVEGWVNSINEYFINNKVYVKGQLEDVPKNSYSVFKKHSIKLNHNDNNYLVINYETFQQDDGEYIVSELLKNNVIDYIILDEVQNVKQRENEAEEQSRRRDTVNKLVIAAREQNKELLVLAMSATPVINNLVEPKKLIELLTSESHNELDTRENIINGVEMYKALTRYGLRYRPKNGIRINEEKIEIDGSELADILVKIPRNGVVEFEKALLEAKLNGIKDKIKKGCLIYTYYVTDIIYVIGDYVKDLGLSVGYYTGDDKSGLKAFKNGKVDVLIGSAPISTGVDGIQKICNTLIPIVLPWTSAEYDQLLGRVDRQGSNFDHVNIYIPQVVIQTNNGEWSWDKRRYNIIKFKATLADLAVDGRVPKNLLPPRTKLLEDAKNELRTWVNRLNNDDIITFEREELKVPLNPTYIKRMRNDLGEISQMHKEWTTRRSENVNKIFQDNPEKWFYYHTLRREKIKSWPEDPLLTIAARLKSRPDWIVADFGCGENRLKTEITNKIHAFDHVAIDDSVIACDVSNVPLVDASVDVVVCCLSLWGPNWEDQVKEASRILKPFGRVFIAEKSSRWVNKENELKTKVEAMGFQCFDAMRNTGKFIYLNGEKL